MLHICLILCPLVFLAGFLDSVAGGGGLISLPAYLLCGFPAHLAAGTNKVVNGIGTLTAAGKFIHHGKVKLKYALIAGAGAMIGSTAGTRMALLLDDHALKIVMLCALPLVAAVLFLKKDFGSETAVPKREENPKRDILVSAAIGLGIGCYDGMVGPGTGTFMIMAFTALMGMDLLTASGCAKVGNLASNIASAVVWLMNGQVMLELVIPAAACSIAGNYLGARYAIRGGSKRVRYMIFVVLALLFGKLIFTLII
ncbi:MAG TPA: sulfite exporter TauE/SafE family protein [Oscillospiraceae bacterium]|nr:sulfite exporter TauE/SafE family protein [Oscillospiraceae bacterium]HRW56539.1 sulfite exporter TauE/SafE family protein [Oscillospiraceae bacterium]